MSEISNMWLNGAGLTFIEAPPDYQPQEPYFRHGDPMEAYHVCARIREGIRVLSYDEWLEGPQLHV